MVLATCTYYMSKIRVDYDAEDDKLNKLINTYFSFFETIQNPFIHFKILLIQTPLTANSVRADSFL